MTNFIRIIFCVLTLGLVALSGVLSTPQLFADWRTTVDGTILRDPLNATDSQCVWTGEKDSERKANGIGLIIYVKDGQIVRALLCETKSGNPKGAAVQIQFSGGKTHAPINPNQPLPTPPQTEIDPLAIMKDLIGSQPSRPSPTPAKRTHVAQPNNSNATTLRPMPQPNYTWIYGSRYTPTAMIEFRQWLDQQSSMSAEERASRYAAQDRQNQEDAQREAEWTIRAFRNPY